MQLLAQDPTVSVSRGRVVPQVSLPSLNAKFSQSRSTARDARLRAESVSGVAIVRRFFLLARYCEGSRRVRN